MAELRYNPISNEWVMISSHRQSQPQMPDDRCPFCAGSGKVPGESYEVFRYRNEFPALSVPPPIPDNVNSGMFEVKPAYGRCEVLLYSDKHTATLGDLTDGHAVALAQMWQECFTDLASDKDIKYVFIFENRGEDVGVTTPHPHGQAYAYPFVPKKLEQEVESACNYYESHDRNLFLDLLGEEKRVGSRIIADTGYFTVYVPFFSPITYGVHVMANSSVTDIGAMTKEEVAELGKTLRDCARMYDSLFDMPLPYMMCMHNAPVNSGDFSYIYQFHVEYFPPLRTADTQKFFASNETGAGAWCNPSSPEEKAEELRRAWARGQRHGSSVFADN